MGVEGVRMPVVGGVTLKGVILPGDIIIGGVTRGGVTRVGVSTSQSLSDSLPMRLSMVKERFLRLRGFGACGGGRTHATMGAM